MMPNDIEKCASALIIMGALVACGQDVQNVEYNIDDGIATTASPKLATREQCYGIALAQYNDCASGNGTHCAGTAHFDYQTDRWKYTETGSCEEKGGSLKPKKDPRVK